MRDYDEDTGYIQEVDEIFGDALEDLKNSFEHLIDHIYSDTEIDSEEVESALQAIGIALNVYLPNQTLNIQRKVEE